jgi:tRNA (guanine-N7-)-methyltransferase
MHPSGARTSGQAGPVDPTADPSPRPPGGVRTTRRRGRTSAAKQAALRDLLPRWQGSLDDATDHHGPVALDVGVGDGAATLAWARARPDLLVVALELHRPGLAKLLGALDADGPPNVRVAEADAVEAIDRAAPASLHAVRVLFPDPWPKRRHVARRLVDRAFVTAVADALEPGGELQVATDWDDYADHVRTMVATEARFEPLGADAAIARPVTAYERRGLDAGRTITDLAYSRR